MEGQKDTAAGILVVAYVMVINLTCLKGHFVGKVFGQEVTRVDINT